MEAVEDTQIPRPETVCGADTEYTAGAKGAEGCMSAPAYAVLPQVARRTAALLADEITILDSVIDRAQDAGRFTREDLVYMLDALDRLEAMRARLMEATQNNC